MNLRITIAVMAIVVIVLSCNQRRESALSSTTDLSLKETSTISSLENPALKDEEPLEEQTPPGKDAPEQSTPPPVPADWDKKIIRNADLQLFVKDAKVMNTAIKEAVRLNGGYIASASEMQVSGQIKNDMIIRVPREKFDALLDQLSGYGDSLLQKNISSEDVTAEYIDTKSRTQAKEKVKDRYYEFLKQARNIEEVLKVQHEIGNLQEEIEAATGRINYIRHQSALSTIHIVFFQQVIPVVTPALNPGFWWQIKDSAKGGWEMIQGMVLLMVRIWPLCITGVIIWLGLRNRKNKTVFSAK